MPFGKKPPLVAPPANTMASTCSGVRVKASELLSVGARLTAPFAPSSPASSLGRLVPGPVPEKAARIAAMRSV